MNRLQDLIHFTHPWLWLLLPPVLTFLYFLGRPLDKQRLISFILHALTVISLFAIITGTQIKAASPHVCRIYLLDNSGSIFLNQTPVLDAIQKNVQSLTPLDRAGLVVFGQDASVEIMPVSPLEFPKQDILVSKVNPLGTDLAGAIRFTFNLFPPGFQKELVILTDGNHTSTPKSLVWGQVPETTSLVPSELIREGITVFTVAIGPQSLSDIRVVSFQLPPSVAPSEPVQARLTLGSTVDTKVNIYLYIDGKSTREIRDVGLTAGQDTYLTLNLPPLDNAVQEYEIRIKTDSFKEICLANNYARAVVQQTGPAAILYLSNQPDRNNLEKIISGLSVNNPAGWQMTSRPAVSEALRNLSLYQLLILDNIRADVFSPEALEQIKNFVSEGGGLLISGGPDSFGLGNYSDTPLEEISPVWATPKHNLALVLLLDKSGSMADPANRHQTKFQVMQESLPRVMALLKESDKLEAAVFGQDVQVIYPMQSFNPSRSNGTQTVVNNTLKKILPAGPTVILPSVKQSLSHLKNVKAERKHIILISDGESTGGEILDDFKKTAEELNQAGVTISILATGAYVNEPFLKALCLNEKNGRYYRIDDINRLSDFLQQDLAFYKELIRENPDIKVKIIQAEDILKGVDSLPDLQGYQRTSLKEQGRLLAAMADNNDPLLASWQYGLGKVLVFTSSLDYQWTEKWLAQPATNQLWLQTLRWLTPVNPADTGKNFKINAVVFNNRNIKISIQSLVKESPGNNLRLQAEIKTPDLPTGQTGGQKLAMEIPQVSSARYELITPVLPEGTYFVSVLENSKTEHNIIARIPVVIPYSAEWQTFKPNLMFLSNLASATGGEMAQSLVQLPVKLNPLQTAAVKTETKIDWLFIILALFFICCDLLLQTPLFKRKEQ